MIEIETWLQSTLEILNVELKTETESQIQDNIKRYNALSEELKDKEAKLQELSRICEEFKKYSDLQELATTLVEQLNTVTLGLIEHKTVINEKIEFLHHQLQEMQKSPDVSLQSTLSSSSMPVEEIAVHADAKKATQDFIAAEKPVTSVTIETQTGRSLTSPPPVEAKSDKPPTDVQIQTHLSETSSESLPAPTKETITVLKTIKNGQETIQIATKPENQPIIEEPDDDVLVQADYRKIQEMPGDQTSQVSILHATRNQPFETVFVEPDETTTEVIVDADGTKRIIVKKLQRTVVRQQQTVQQQQLTTTKTLTEDDIPVSQSFSQITLQGQQSSTTLARGDGRKEMLTTQSYGGKVVSGAPGSEVTVHEFETEPESNYTVVEATEPPEVEVQGVKLREGDVTFVDDQHATLIPADSEIHTSSSSVRAVVQQVTRRVIRRTRRIIRRIVIVDGKEQVTEEVVEEPEEVEFTEEGIPRVSINVTRTEDGRVVQDQQFGEATAFPPESEGVTVTRKVTSVVIDADGKPVEKEAAEVQRYVVEQPTAPPENAPALVTDTAEIISEPNTETTAANLINELLQQEKASALSVDSSKVELALGADLACELKTAEQVPKDEPAKESEVEIAEVRVEEHQPAQEVISVTPSETPLSIEEVDSCQQPEVKADITLHEAEINTTKQITSDFIANEQTFRPITPEADVKKASASEEEKPISPKDKSKKKRKLKGKKQQVCTPRIQSPAIPPEDEEILDLQKEIQPLEALPQVQQQEEKVEAPASEDVQTSKALEAEGITTQDITIEEQAHFPVAQQSPNKATLSKTTLEEFLTQEIKSAEVIEAPEVAKEAKPEEVPQEVQIEALTVVQETQTSITSDTTPSVSEEAIEQAKPHCTAEVTVQTSLSPEVEPVNLQQEVKEIPEKLEEHIPSEEVKVEAVVQETQTSFSPESASATDENIPEQVDIGQETQTSFPTETDEQKPTLVDAKLVAEFIAQETQTSLSPENVDEDKPSILITEVAPVKQEPDITVIATEAIQKEKEQAKTSTVEFELTLEEKRPEFEISPKIEASVLHEEQVVSDINATLPTLSEKKVETIQKTVALTPFASKTETEHTEPSTPSDVDRGGRKSKKKKKHKESKTPSEQEEVVIAQEVAEEESPEKATPEAIKESAPQTPDTSLAESTDIILSESQVSEETPKPTQEVFEPITQTEESEHTDKEEGYEADKATVDEGAPGEEGDKKKRKKKKRKQKLKVEESDETQVPLTTTDTSTAGESFKFSDEEDEEQKPVSEPVKKSKKHKKGKKHRETEVEEQAQKEDVFEGRDGVVQEAEQEEIISPHDDSYKTISTPSEPGTVKIVEEKVITPENELPRDITSKIVTTVPVIEAVITQEAPVQTSPDVSEITTEFIKQETVQIEQAAVQTSPEIPKEVSEIALQTAEPEVEVQQIPQPEVIESSSQVVIETIENITQTSTPQQQEVVTAEIAMQTVTPEKSEIVEEFVQTITPEPAEVPTSETAMQTIVVESQEESIQTITPQPQPLQEIETTEISTQAKPFDIVSQSAQTSPIPSAPPLEQITQTSPVQELHAPSVETTETVSQTQPVIIHEIGEVTPPSSTSEQYEVFVQTAVTIPGRETVQITTDRSEIPISVTSEGKLEVAPVVESPSEQSASDFENVDVQVTVADKHAATVSLLEAERDHDQETRRRRRKRKHGDEKQQQQPDSIEKDDLFASFKQQEASSVSAGIESYANIARRSRTPSPVRTVVDVSEVPLQQAKEEPEEVIPKQTSSVVVEEEQKTQKEDSVPPVQAQPSEDTAAKIQQATQIDQDVQPLVSKEELVLQQTSETILQQPTEAAPVEEPSTIVNISITIPPESPSTISETPEPSAPLQEASSSEARTPTSVTSELTIDTSEEIIQPPKTKTASKKSNKRTKSVAIEEVLSPTEVVDTPVTPSADAPLSPPDYSRVSYTWDKPSRSEVIETQKLLKNERAIELAPLQDIGIRWNQAQAIERVKNLQNANRTTHLSDVLYLATLNEIITEESIEERNFNVQQNINALREAVVKKDVVEIQHTVITTVQTITTWLETIEYRIYLARQQTADGPSKERVQELSNLKSEITSIESNVAELQSALNQAGDVYNEDDRNRMENYIDSLQEQVKVIEEVTKENEQLAIADLTRWEEFVSGVNDLNRNIGGIKRQLSDLTESDASPQTKFNELERLENANRLNMVKSVALITTAKGLMRDFPGREIPQEIYGNQDLTKQIEHSIEIEREKILQLLSLADEYEQTLKEFSQIIDIADALVESPILVRNLEHLEEEMQNHRKFFVNLSHCRAILESLEQNLDSETRALHSELHQNLYERSRVSLDKATGRFQQMSLAASRWTVLEQGMKEEQRWLQVAQQRVPDLSSVTSADYDQYINLYQSLSLDIAHHHAKLSHLNGIAEKLQELVICSELEETYIESLEIIKKLQEDVQNNLKRLMAFRDMWGSYNLLSDKLEVWLKDAEDELSRIESSEESEAPVPGQMRQFWVRTNNPVTKISVNNCVIYLLLQELKAQHEVHNGVRLNAANALEKSMQVVPVADEMVQRKFHSELQDQWQKVSDKINNMQTAVLENISAPDVPINEKLALLEQELLELKSTVDNLQGIIKTEEELNLYVERLQVMSTRVDTIQNELGRLGLLSAAESEKVGTLLALSKRLNVQISEELEGGNLLKERLDAIQRGLVRIRKKHEEISKTLDNCESAEKLGSEAVEKAVIDCTEAGEELVTLWQDLMGLRQLLHTLPMRLRVTVSPIKVERDISQLQDDHTALEKRCGQLLALLRGRLALWQRFERQLELVQQSVQEADFMMDLLTVQGNVDYDRLLKATERLEVS